MLDYFPANYKHQHQTDDKQRDEDVAQTVVACKNLTFRTDEGDAPCGAFQRLIEHDARFPVHIDTHVSSLSRGHFVSQHNDVVMFMGING